ncbi:MAG: aldehyde dehydrogenase family protein [Rhodobacteraceae bacterium]|nr:aldehyde dehydrogenase family protein [Paracoccaceae bacterium]
MTQIVDIMDTMEYGPAPECNAHAREWLAGHRPGIGHYIDGRFTEPGDNTFAVYNPATGDELARVAAGGKTDVHAAVQAARMAFPAWSALSGHQRARYLYAIARHLQKRERFFAVLETMNNGKTIRETRDIDVPLAARHFLHHAGWAELLEEEFSGQGPIGICGQIIPWNFPLLMLAWKIAPALAAGNTVVLKPAELTPLTAVAFAELCREVGLPAGVVNIVHGDGATGTMIVRHKGIDKIAFTGSTEVGRAIREATAGTGKKLSLELGGKSPFIVFDDADLDSTIEGVVDAIWFNQGQVCCAGSRILVQESVSRRLVKRLRERMEMLRIGDPLDKAMDVGALISQEQLRRVARLVGEAEEAGAILHRSAAPLPPVGHFFSPCFLEGVDPAAEIFQTEVFGPVATVTTFRTPAEAVELGNNTRYGLAASVWSQNIDLALDTAARLKAGVVWVNATNLFDAAAGFGGYRESGFGREGGREGLREYLAPLGVKSKVKAHHTGALKPSAWPGVGPIASATIDRTAKQYIGGRKVRPDSGQSYSVVDGKGRVIGQAALGNRKDIRDAVEAAASASRWGAESGHRRAQVLYFIAENLSPRRQELERLLITATGASAKAAAEEVEATVRCLFRHAALADKFDGAVHSTHSRHVTLAMNEPWGVLGIVCPDAAPLLSLVSLVAPAIALGNCVVAIPSERYPLLATLFYELLETSDVPAGVLNLVTGAREDLALTLARHAEVAALWYDGLLVSAQAIEAASAGNLKHMWNYGSIDDWAGLSGAELRELAQQSVQTKNIWIPYGE